jgi:hypothetical protein
MVDERAGRFRRVGSGEDTVDKDEFFDRQMYMIAITGWPRDDFRAEEPVTLSGDARLALWQTEPADGRHIPPPGADGVLFGTPAFSLMNSGRSPSGAARRTVRSTSSRSRTRSGPERAR